MIDTFSLINRLPRAAADSRQRTLLRRCGFSGFTWEDSNTGFAAVMTIEFITALRQKKASTVIHYG